MANPKLKYGAGLYLLWLILIPLAFLLVAPTWAAPPPITLESYWRDMEETHEIVRGLKDASTEDSKSTLIAEAERWEAITEIGLADGRVMPVSHSFLVAQLRADPPEIVKLEQILGAMLAARERLESADQSPNLEALDHILARPEFQWETREPSPVSRWIQRLLDSVSELFARLLPDEISFGALSVLQYALTGLGLLAFILTLTYMFRGIRAAFVGEAELDLEIGDDQVWTATTAMKHAQKLSESGDLRTSVRYLYLSTLLLLDERGLVRYDRSLTNREYLVSVADHPRLAATLADVIEIFELVWYGHQPIEQGTFAQYAAQVQELNQKR